MKHTLRSKSILLKLHLSIYCSTVFAILAPKSVPKNSDIAAKLGHEKTYSRNILGKYKNHLEFLF